MKKKEEKKKRRCQSLLDIINELIERSAKLETALHETSNFLKLCLRLVRRRLNCFRHRLPRVIDINIADSRGITQELKCHEICLNSLVRRYQNIV